MPGQASSIPIGWLSAGRPFRFASAGGGDDEPQNERLARLRPADGEELPYKVELWDEQGLSVEQVLAVTANGSIGYAAYYAATREHSDRYITLRHRNSIISRWNGPKN
ncbi:MAG: hypothetical protein JOY64_04870 [Alphaproteobacteria bacterium]|nr:hypothetical protein [Alphaproteobacteria bacterium]MBV8406941.1 hypothetical protein [Alphaproteobacteria bacterium]